MSKSKEAKGAFERAIAESMPESCDTPEKQAAYYDGWKAVAESAAVLYEINKSAGPVKFKLPKTDLTELAFFSQGLNAAFKSFNQAMRAARRESRQAKHEAAGVIELFKNR